MNHSTASHSFADDWDVYWRGKKDADPQSEIAAQDEAPSAFWKKFLGHELRTHEEANFLDAACGYGAVTEIALAVSLSQGTSTIDLSCMDYSASAIKAMEERFPGVKGVACDATDTPYSDGQFDIVASQFGLEYAGAAAFEEAARLVAAGGVLVALVHMKKGAIFDECAANLSAIQSIQESRLLPLAREAFDAGFAVARGNAPQSRFLEADKNFAPAVENLKQTLRKHGPLLEHSMILRIGTDLAHMYQRIEAYLPQEFFAWLDRTDTELAAYAGRMQSMVNAALDETEIKGLSDLVASKGLTSDTYDVLKMRNSGEPAAWVLVARRIAQA